MWKTSPIFTAFATGSAATVRASAGLFLAEDHPDWIPTLRSRAQTGVEIEVTGLVGVFTTPDHVIEYREGDKVTEVRQPVNVCLHARPVGGEMTTSDEASLVRWVAPGDLGEYSIHPALRRRIEHGLSTATPYVD